MYEEGKFGIGNDRASQEKRKENNVLQVGGVRRLDGTNKGCGRGQKGQAKISTGGNVADGFLRASFPSKLAETDALTDARAMPKLEEGFWIDLCAMCEEMGLNVEVQNGVGFPYNISRTVCAVRDGLREMGESDWKSIRIVEHQGQVFPARHIVYDTAMTLFYIPVEPLYKMLQDKERRETAQLMVSVFAYLYQIADIPYYRQEDSYLWTIYDMLQQCKQQDGEDESECELAEQMGDHIENQIADGHNLKAFGDRLRNFSPKDGFDESCLEVANGFWELYKQYPSSPIHRNIERIPEDVLDEDGAVEWYNYVSFCASHEGGLFDSMMEIVNSELREKSEINEPVMYKLYNGRAIEGNDLHFEEGIFRLIDELSCVLNEYNK
ncbi:hypothetical protein [Fluviicola sp.]|uniref:hypothetical protein n=1 Tax=Fluviicola sp. TaxID=1917219 RepID=UPI0031CE3798